MKKGWYIVLICISVFTILSTIVSIQIIIEMFKSGVPFAANVSMELFFLGLFVVITGFSKKLKIVYVEHPTLYFFHILLLANLLILEMVEIIMSKGLVADISTTRRMIVSAIAVVAIIVGRFALSFYFKKHPIFKEDSVENE